MNSGSLKRMKNEITMFVVLVALVAFFSLSTDKFLTGTNLINVMRQIAMIGITSIGMTFIILTAGMDLSAGSVLAVSGIVTGVAMVNFGISPPIAILIGLLSGVIVGLINGLVIAYFKIPPFVTTLGSMQIFKGAAFIITGGMPVFGFPRAFGAIGKGYVSFIPIPVIIMIVLMAVGWVVLNKTKYGRHLYAIGGNMEAARLSGVKVNKQIILTYILGGLFAAVAGIIMAARVDAGQPNVGLDFGLDVITAVVLGGVSIMGGEGKLTGVIIGVLIMGVLDNGLIMMNVYEYYQYVIKGLVLLLAVGFDQFNKYNRIRARKELKQA